MKTFKLIFSCAVLTILQPLTGAQTSESACADTYESKASRIDAQKYPAFARFVTQHTLPEEYREAVNHCHKSKEGYHFFVSDTPWKIEDSSLYFKGNDLSRIFNACRIKKCIETHGLNHLEVATKYVEKAGSEWKVFAQAVPGKPVRDCRFSKTTVEQLISFGQKTGFSDWGSNWVWNEERNTLVCIDTEDISFSFYPLESLSALKKFWGKCFSPESLELLEEKIEIAEKNHRATVHLSRYDCPESNFEQVRKEFAQL